MPIYNFKGDTYNIPDSLSEAFENDNPDATIKYSAGGDNYEIPVKLKKGFLKDFPDAKLITADKPVNNQQTDTAAEVKSTTEFPQPVDAVGNPITNNGQPYSQEILAQYYSANNKGGSFKDLATLAAEYEQKQPKAAAPAPVKSQPTYKDFGFDASNPSPIQPAEEKPYEMPLMFKDKAEQIKQQAASLELNREWTKTQQQKYNTILEPGADFGQRMEAMQQAADVEGARKKNRSDFDAKNFDTFFNEHVSPVFAEEKGTAEQRVQEFAERGRDKTGGLLAKLAGKVRTDYAQEKYNDPQKVANTTLQRVQSDDSFGEYLLNRMGITGNTTTDDNNSPQLSSREIDWMKQLFAKETQEVSDQIIQRLYDNYQSQGAPNSVLDYISGKAFNENLAAQLYKSIIQRAAGSSGLREQLRAMAYDEFGKDQSWVTRMAGGAAPFAVDALSGAFMLPNYVGQAVVKGGVKLAAQQVAKQMERRAAARGLENAAMKAAAQGSEEIAQRYIATQAPILNIAMNTAGSAANFATYETQNEIARQIASGEFKPIDIMKEAVHGALLGSAMGAVGGAIGRAARNAGTLGKVGAEAAGIGAETGIFTLSAGLQKAMQDGVDIEDVDWADTAGEAFGTVIGMKSVGAVMHPKTFLNRYRKSKDYDLQLNKHDLEELRQAGYSFDDIFKGLGKFGEITPMQSTTISKAKEYTPGPEGTATKKETTSEESWIDADTYEAIMRNPEISTSAKRKLVYVATGKILAPEPAFSVSMDTNSDGHTSITTLNAFGAPIETKDYKNENEAKADFDKLQEACRANTIGGLERIAEKSGHPEVVDEAKGRTTEETGVDVDNLDQMGDLDREEATKVLDNYVKNLQEAYMQRFNEDLERIGQSAAENTSRGEISSNEPEIPQSETETTEEVQSAPIPRSERRTEAYQKGVAVINDDSILSSIGHDNRVATARMAQLMPDGSNTEAVRKNIMQAVDDGDIDTAEDILERATPYLNKAQIEAVENYLDAATTQMGIEDAVTQQASDYMERHRQQLENISDAQGNITKLQLRDGSVVYLKAGDLNNHYSTMIVVDENGNTSQHLVSEIISAEQPVKMDDLLTDDVNKYAEGVQQIYNDMASGLILNQGQEIDFIVSGRPFHATVIGYDDFGNANLTLEDGSKMSYRSDVLQKAIAEAEDIKIQQQLQEEAESARLAEQKQRYSAGIKGYDEGQVDLSAPETDAKAAADFILSMIQGDEKARKQQLTDINTTKEQLQQRSEEAKREITQLTQWLSGNEDIADTQEVEETRRKLEELKQAVTDLDARRTKWNEIGLNLMTKEELAAMEQKRRREIFNARTGYQPQVEQHDTRTNTDGIIEEDGIPNFGLSTVGNVNNYLLRNYPESYEAERFINGERLKLRDVQRDEIQPAMNERNNLLNAYAAGQAELTSAEVKSLVQQIADLEARQDQLSRQAVRLREIADGIQALYERNKRTEELSPAEQRASELDKANSKEDKIRLARTLYNSNPEALDVISNLEPRELDEFIADNLGINSMNWEGFDRGNRHVIGVQEAVFGKKGATRGIGKGYSTNAFNMYLAPTGEGKGFDEIVHAIYEAQPDLGDTKRWSTEEISSELINMFLSAQKPSDISHRIIDNRIAEAEAIMQRQEEYDRDMEEMAKLEEMQQWAEAYHLTPEEREDFEEFMKMAPTEPEQEIINKILADEQDSRSNEVDIQSANRPAGAKGEGSQGEVLGQGAAAAPAGNQEQPRLEGGQAGDGVEAVSDTDVPGGTPEQLREIKNDVNRIAYDKKKDITLQQAIQEVDSEIEARPNINVSSEDDLQSLKGAGVGEEILDIIRGDLSDDSTIGRYMPELGGVILYGEKMERFGLTPVMKKANIYHENVHALGGRGYTKEDFAETARLIDQDYQGILDDVRRDYADQDEEIQNEEVVARFVQSIVNGGPLTDFLKGDFKDGSSELCERINNVAKLLSGNKYGKQNANNQLGGDAETQTREPEENRLEGDGREQVQEAESDNRGVENNSFSARLAKAIAETNTHPTEAQKEAGNYRKPELKFGGYIFRIENPKGSTRSGVDASGKPWSQEMHDTYGYIEEKTGKDGDKIDFFINDDADLDSFNGRVYVIDQKNEDGSFDEHKVMYGYPTLGKARDAYKRNYEKGWWDKHVMSIIGVKKADFDKWLDDSDHKTKPFAEYYRTRILKDAIRDDVDQLLADVEERKTKEPEVVPSYNEQQLEKMDLTTISQLLKKARKDAATSRTLLATTNVKPGSEKEKTLRRNIAQAEKDTEVLNAAQEKLREQMQRNIENAEAGGAMIDHLQDIGVDVTADIAVNRKVRKQAERDNSKEGKLRNMRTADGDVYGFTYKGKLYLDPRKIDANLPLHEYSHLWGEAMRRLNPEEWNNIVGLMKQDADTWKFVKQLNPDLDNDDDVAEEMIAMGTGSNGEQRVREEFERISKNDPSYKGKWNNIWKNISKAIQDFWKQVGDFLHIRYESTQQVYDQVLKDFANGVNPRKKVEEYLKQRDAEYAEAVKSGDTKKATQIFNDALKENVGNGMTPYIAVDKYRKMQSLAHKIKNGDAKGISQAAELMAPLIPENAVLIPTPSHSGKATTILQLANAIAERTGSEVADILESSPRASQYEIKKQRGKAIAAKDMGIVVNGQIPEGKVPVVIDNVVDTGNTAEACIKALGTGIVASLADSTEIGRRVASLRSAAPIIANREGELVPLSQRFDLSRKETARPVDIDNLMDEVDNRIDTAGRMEVEAAIESDKAEAGVKAVNTAARDRATKAVVKVVSDTGVPIKQVSREEADQMMQLFTMMNRQAITDFARSQRPSEIKRYAVINVRDPFAVPKYFEKRQYAQEYKVWGNQGRGLYDLLDLGYDDTTEQNTELKEAADIMPMVGWHGSAAVFTKFDHSHIGEGAGSQSFGWGTYLSGSKKIGSDYARMLNRGWTYQGKHLDDIEAIHDGKNHKSGAIRDILSAMNHGDRLKDAKERNIRFIKSAIRDYEEEMQHLSDEDKQDLNDMREILSFIESLKMEDFKKDPENLYKVEIPEDTGDNYLPYIETIKKSNRRKIADVVRNLEGEPRKSFVYANYKNGWNSLADMIEREQWAYKEVEDRLLHALGGRLADAKKVSELMSKAGFVGVKYPAGTIFGGGEGATNYVIFNEDDAKIVEHIQFMFDNAPQTEQPIFYSNAMKAVEAIKQDKATPDQWLAMIQKNGGFKAGEDKWLGLRDWLNTAAQEGAKTVNKQQILDYIKSNQIPVEEVTYREYFNMDDNPKMKEFRKEFDDLREKYYDEANKAWRDTENFNQEMDAKYGYGWANKLDETDQKRSDEITERYEKYFNESPSTLAFQEMVDKYGDDFEQGFYVDYGSDTLEPNSDMYDEGISDAAKHFLELNDQPINDTRLNYTTAGLDNKREIAITVPTIEPYNANDEIHFGDAGEGRAVVWVRFGDATIPIRTDVAKTVDDFEEPWDNGRGMKLYYPKGSKPGWGKDYIVYRKDVNDNYVYGVIVDGKDTGHYDTFDEAKKALNDYYQNHPESKVTGETKVLVIDEIQSKRHQDAREKGYSNANDIPKKHGWTIIDDPYNPKIFNSNGDRLTRNPDMVGQKDGDHTFVLATEDEWRDISEYFTRKRQGIPDAPFEKNWHEVAMKRMLRYAAEHGYDKIAWTTGAQQAERYSLSNIVKSIEVGNWGEDVNGEKLEVEQGYKGKSNWVPESDVEKAIKDYIEYCMENGDTFSMSVAYANNQITDAPNESKGWTYDAVLKVADAIEADLTGYKDARGVVINVGDDLIGMSVNRDGKILDSSTTDFVGKSLADVVGKEVALMIVGKEGKGKVDAGDLAIGGEGMKGFYDDILPRFMNKYGKKWGVKVGEIELPDLEESAKHMWSVDVTPEMKESVMQGQPMFQKERGGRVYGWTDGQGIFLTPDGMNPNTPIHEYTHIWDKYIQKNDPALWKEMVETFKKTDIWRQIRENPNYRSIWNDDDKMASEVHSRLSGESGEQMFTAAAADETKDTGNIIKEVKRVLKKFWDAIARLFKLGKINDDRLQEFVNMPLRDLLRKVNPVKGSETDSTYPEAMIEERSAGEAKIVRLNRLNQYGLDENNPIGRKLTEMKKKSGKNALLGYIDTDFSGYVFLGDDARTISSIKPKYKVYDDNGMPAVYVNTKDFDSLSPLLVAKGYMMGLVDPSVIEEEPELLTETEQPTRPEIKSWSQGELFTDADFMEPEPQAETEVKEPDTVQAKESPDLTQIRLRKLDEGEECHVERVYEEEKVFTFTGSNRIESLDDVAYIFRQLQNASVENTFVVLEKDGVPTIIHLAMGGFTSSPVPAVNAFAAYSELKPDNVYFIHNHPSGRLVCSKQDQDVYRDLVGIFGSKLREGIIINTTSGKYGVFNSNRDFGTEQIPTNVEKEVPMKVYSFSKQVFAKDWNPENAFTGNNALSVAKFVSSHRLGQHKKMSLLVMDQAMHITGNVFLPWTKLSDAVSRDNAQLIATYVTQMGGNCCALYGNYGYDQNDEIAVKDFQLMLDTRNIRLIDLVNMEEDSSYYHSMKEQGVMESGAMAEGFVSEPVTDENEIKRLDKEPKETGYRNVVINENGTLGSPMASKLNKVGVESKPTSSFEIGKWERSDENPQLATDDGKINLVKPGNKRVSGVDYNPYIHIRPNKVNKQFKQAWERPNLVYIETEYPTSELNGDYKAEKAALPVGKHPWGGGELILSRWDKPVRIVPWEEVADDWEKEFKDRGVEFDIVPPALLPILSKRGVEILPPHKGMGKDCQDAYKAWEDGIYEPEEQAIMYRRGNRSSLVLTPEEDKLVTGILNTDKISIQNDPNKPNSEISVIYDIYKNKQEGWRKKVADWALSILPASVKTSFGDVEFRPAKLRGALSHGYGDLKLLTLPHLATMLKNGVLFDKRTEDNGMTYYNVAHMISYNGEDYVVRMVAREDQNGKLFYDHEFTEIKKIDAPAAGREAADSTSPHQSAANILNNLLASKLFGEKVRLEHKNSISDIASETGDALGGVKVKSVTYNQATDAEKKEIEKGNKGFYDPNTGEVTLLTDNISDAEDAKRTVFHEKLGHEGLVALLGNQGEVNKFGHFVFKSASKELKQRIIEKADANDPNWNDPLRFSHAAQEVIADIAENGPRTADEFSLWQKIKHYIIRFCNMLGLRIKGLLNDHDLSYYILKTGEALKKWNGMTEQQKQEAAAQGYDKMYSRKGKPRKRNNESMAQYLQRLREWEKWKEAERQARENGDPMPDADEINSKWEEKYKADLAEWRSRTGIEYDENAIGAFPKREKDESPQDYAARVADYETQVDLWKEAPSFLDYMQKANEEYKRDYLAWRERYDLVEAENVDLNLYEGTGGEGPVTDSDLQTEEVVMHELAQQMGIDLSSEGAKSHARLAVIERRKNIESANAEDAIWIFNLTKSINEEAKRQGVEPKELRKNLADIIEGTYFEDVIKDEHGNIISIEDISESLPIKMTPGLQAILDDIKAWYDEFYSLLDDARLTTDAGYIPEGYVNHVWDKKRSDAAAYEKYVENYQRTKSRNMRERIFDTYRAGEDVGLVRKFDDITEILAYYSSDNNKAIGNRKFLDDLSGLMVEEKNSDGEIVSVLPLLNSSKPDALSRDRYEAFYVPGVGDVYVLKDVEKFFSNIFGSIRTKHVPEIFTKVGRVLDTAASTSKKIELALSGFHALALWEVQIAQQNPIQGLKALLKYVLYDSFKNGWTVPAYAHPEDFKFAAKHLVQLGATEDYAASDVKNITGTFKRIVNDLMQSDSNFKKAAGMAGSLPAYALDFVNRGFDTVLWNYMHDGLKIYAMNHFKAQIDKRAEKQGLSDEEREKLYDEAGQYVNDMFGGQWYEILGMSPAAIKWARRALLSPDWFISTQRHFFAMFGIGSLYSEGGFVNWLKYNADNIKRVFGVDIPRDEYKRFRSRNAKICYLIGAVLFFGAFYNAINMLNRWIDEEDEKRKADEIRKTFPDYKSPYEIKYPDGMKWYDYTMYGNAPGQRTHLFTGRYHDGTETYVRWGKQFREFPELFIGKEGFDFPTPILERLMSKKNPLISGVVDFLGAAGVNGFEENYRTKEIVERYGRKVAMLKAFGDMFVPFGVPTQPNKEYKLLDFFMPSSKGFSKYKAIHYYEKFIQEGDMDGVRDVYNACVMNGVDAEACLKAAMSTIRATQRKDLADGIVDLSTAVEHFNNAKDLKEKKVARNKMIKYLTEQGYKSFTREEAVEAVEKFMNGEQATNEQNDRYISLESAEDIRDDWHLSAIRKQSKQYMDMIKTAEGDRQKKLAETYQPWIQINAIIKQGDSNINKLKKQLGKGGDDNALMKKIRDIRTETQKKVDEIQAP